MKEQLSEPVTVYSVRGMLRANVIQGVLKSAGIPVHLRYETIGTTLGLAMDRIGQVDIQVPAEWESEALDLLKAEPKTAQIFAVPDDVIEEMKEQE